MESERFDAVTRRLSAAATRRGVLGVLVGVVSLGLEEVAAKQRHYQARQHQRRHRLQAQRGDNSQGDSRKPNGATCKQDVQCRSGVCGVATTRKHRKCCDPTACGECTTCDSSGQCVPVGDPFAGVDIPCGGQSSCRCTRTREGTTFCALGRSCQGGTQLCFTDADCARITGPGSRCLLTTNPNCAGGVFCANPCPTS